MNIAFSKSKTVTSEQHNSEIADWKDVALEDVTSEITVGYVGPMASEYIEKGIPFLRSQNVDFLRVNTKDIKHITPKFHDRLKKSALKPGDVVIVRTGKPGTCSVIPAWLPVANCSDLVIVRCSDKLNADFLSYYVNSVSSYHVATHLVGAVQQHFNVESARKIRLKLPPIEEQKVISEFLGTLDKKIDLNQRMNGTLENIGQVIFKRWFVDFEFPNEEGNPYKSSGGEMVYSEELDENIPRDWIVRELGQLIKFVKGKKPPMVALTQDEGFQPQILIDAFDGHSHFFAQINGMVIVKVTDSLMVMDGASSGRIERGQQGVLGSTIAKIETHEVANAFVYHFLKQKQEDIKQNTTGTSIPHADKSKIQKYLIATPADDSIMCQFETTSKILLLKSINNCNQIRALQEMRDMLLPKLMSGKIRVPIDNKMESQ